MGPAVRVYECLCQDLEDADREKRRLERRAKLDAFHELLKVAVFIKEDSKWEDVRFVTPFCDDPAYLAVDEADRVLGFKVRWSLLLASGCHRCSGVCLYCL